jgi:hypothetical protein
LNCVFDLIRLQRADEVKSNVRIRRTQWRPFFLRLLNTVFTEASMACSQNSFDTLRRMGLADCDKRNRIRVSPGRAGRAHDALFDIP